MVRIVVVAASMGCLGLAVGCASNSGGGRGGPRNSNDAAGNQNVANDNAPLPDSNENTPAANVNGSEPNANAGASENTNANDAGNANDSPANVNAPAGAELTFSTTLSGDQQVPPVETGASGHGSFTLNAERTELAYNVTIAGLESDISTIFFHDGPPGVPGPNVYEITDPTFPSPGLIRYEGVWPLGDGHLELLLSGQIYIDVHTLEQPAGELRGQVVALP